MKLVDTSAWIHSLRRGGDPVVRARVRELLENGEASWCSMVRLELWNGASGEHERRVLKDFDRDMPELATSKDVWNLAFDLSRLTREKGKTVPSTDLLIAACARHHGVEVEHADSHFDLIAALY